jgi:outer membrane protein TolC
MSLEIKRAAFSVLENQRTILEEEVRLGLAVKNDLLESEILLAEAAVEIASMELDMAENETRFAQLIGLEKLPPLLETINVNGDARYPEIKKVQSEILSRNPDLITARLSLKQREEEAKFARLSWIPTIKGNGNFSVTGSRYPLTHYRWSFGLTVDFSMPWVSSTTAGTYGKEGQVDTTARAAQSLTLLPDLAAGLTAKNARLSLELERAVYDSSFSRMERTAVIMMHRLDFTAQKKNLAVRMRELAAEKNRIAELKQSLGFITRLELMQSGIDYAKAEIAAVNAAVEEAAAVREVERLAALLPGGLKELGKH